ncbi:MAG: PorP/SprF family type IX secretion system membrane protein [Marinoscillum sp.]
MRKGLTCILFFISFAISAQFSQFNLTDIRVNPAFSPIYEDAALHMLYRSQFLNGNSRVNTSYVQGIYPFKLSNSLRAGAQITAMDDRFGIAGIYRSNFVGLGGALNIKTSRTDFLGLGFNANFKHSFASLGGLNTGSQFIVDRGFMGSDSNEPLEDIDNSYITGDLGFIWEKTTERYEKMGYLALAMYNFTRPNESFYESDIRINPTYILNTEWCLMRTNRMTLSPNLMIRKTGAKSVLATGVNVNYSISHSRRESKDLMIGVRYFSTGIGSLSLQYNTSWIGYAVNFDMPLKRNGYGSAFEVGLIFRKEVAPRKYRKKSSYLFRSRVTTPLDSTQTVENEIAAEAGDPEVKPDTTSASPGKSHLLYITPGQIVNLRPIELDDTLRFNFPTDGIFLEESYEDVLKLVVEYLENHDDYYVTLTGHTDDVGHTSYNQRLGHKRAAEVAGFLLDRGVDWGRIFIESEGESSPLAPNTTEENRARNRRVDMTFSY